MWREYETTRSRPARDRLIVHYSPVVKFVAKRAQGRMPNGVEDAELVSWGVFGLIDAIEKFDRSRGVDFETYAPRRIAGAIADELRSLDWVPRSVRRKTAALERAAARLQGELKRHPSDAELSGELGVSQDALHQTRAQISHGRLVALDEPQTELDGDRPASGVDRLADGSLGPVDRYQVDETKRLLAAAINRLPDRERLVLTLYYYEGLTQAEIGAALCVTESRICQILSKAHRELGDRIRRCGLVDDPTLLETLSCSAQGVW